MRYKVEIHQLEDKVLGREYECIYCQRVEDLDIQRVIAVINELEREKELV